MNINFSQNLVVIIKKCFAKYVAGFFLLDFVPVEVMRNESCGGNCGCGK